MESADRIHKQRFFEVCVRLPWHDDISRCIVKGLNLPAVATQSFEYVVHVGASVHME